MRKLSQLLVLLRTRSLRRSLGLLAIIAVFSPTWLAAQTALPQPKHIVIVIEENHSYDQIMKFVKDNNDSYMKSLMSQGATFTSFFALRHPSQSNYILLFSGDRQGVKADECLENKPLFPKPSLGGELIGKGLSFKGYAEGLPSAGSTVCESGKYARKHCPWVDFADIKPQNELSLPFSEFPQDPNRFDKDLPTVAMVIPNLNNDMHDGKDKIGTADKWLKKKLEGYVEWAKSNNSLLIVTWDEDNTNCGIFQNDCDTKPRSNRIPTIFIGSMVKSNYVSDKQYTHLDLLRMLEEMYGLPLLGDNKNAIVIADIWK